MKHIYTLTTLLLAIISFSSCNDPSGPITQGFDRKAMLEFTAKQTIIPLFGDMQQSAKSFDSTLQVFIQEQNEQNAQELRNQWRSMAKAWQYVVIFDFGPSKMSDGSLFENIGTFPTSSLKIESYINAKDSSFRNFDRDSRGIYALEYLIFKDSTNFLRSTAEQPFKLAYAKAISRNIVSRVDSVLSQWQNSYGTIFINNDGSQAGSSISDLYNAFVFHYEVLKNYNLGLPMGKRAGQIKEEPTKVEGYYSGYSIQLLKSKYEAIKYLWYGYARLSLTSSLSPLGFKDYLQSVELGPRLIQDTELQWQAIELVLANLDPNQPLQNMINAQSSALDQLFLEITKHTRFLKSEMSSLLGISITFSSSDGD